MVLIVPPHFDPDQTRVLRILRLAWAATILTVIAFGAILFLALSGQTPSASASQNLVAIALVGAFAGGALGYFARMQSYKRHWIGDRIQHQGYFTGNLFLFGFIDAGGAVVAVCAFLSGRAGPELMMLIVPLLLLALNFPNGRAMLGEGHGRLGTGG